MLTILRAFGAYWFLLLMMRVMGRRTPTQMTPFEIILIFFFGGMTMQAVVDDDKSLINAVLGLATIMLTHLIASTLKQRFPAIGKILDGTPVVVFSGGEWHRESMDRVRVTHQDVMSTARQKGIAREEMIRYAIVERNGSISIIRN